MSTLTSPQYAFDPTGRLPANLIPGELQALTGVASRDFYVIVPACTPFFAESVVLSFKNTQGDIRPLVEGVDFYFTHFFLGATRACGKPIYGSITFLNTTLRGTLTLSYQTIGGEWTVDSAKIAEILADEVHNPRTTTWEQVSGVPTIFPVIDHEWNLVDLVGMKEVQTSLDAITDALLAAATSAMTIHINTVGNAHHLTAGDIGAVTEIQMNAAIQSAVQDGQGNTDHVAEGTTNKYFAEARVLATVLAGYTVGTNVVLSEQDNVLAAFRKLQGQLTAVGTALANKASLNRPAFTGLSSSSLVKLTMTGVPLSIDISTSGDFQVNVTGSGAIGFNTANVGDMTNKVVEFSITTINDGTAGAYALAWPSNVHWVDGTPPPRSTSPNAVDLWYFVSIDNMATWTGSLSNANPR